MGLTADEGGGRVPLEEPLHGKQYVFAFPTTIIIVPPAVTVVVICRRNAFDRCLRDRGFFENGEFEIREVLVEECDAGGTVMRRCK